MSRENVVGHRYGKLTVLCDLPDRKDATGRFRRWARFQCDCGNTTERRLIEVRHRANTGNPSCGCERKRNSGRKPVHGMRNSKEYRAWRNMKQRCYVPNNVSYSRYGGKGITVCDRWRNSFEIFYADMGAMPEGKRISIGRVDNDKDYEPGNCKWETPRDQANNRSSNIVYEGKTIAEHARSLGIDPHIIYDRLRYGWTLSEAIFTPIDNHKGA